MKQYIVIGIGRFGSSIARTLCALGHEVLAVDSDADRVQDIAEHVTHAVQADAADEHALGIRNFDVAIINIGDIRASAIIALMCKEAGVGYVLAKANDELHAKLLNKIGVDKVVLPEREMGIRVANMLISSNVLDYIDLSPDYTLMEIAALDGWCGRSIRDIGVRARYGVTILAIKRGDDVNVAPTADDVIRRGDILVVIGAIEKLHRMREAAGNR